MRCTLVALAVLVFSFVCISPAGADQLPAGHVIQARGGQQALFIWDASDAVASITAGRTDATPALRALEAAAMNIAASRAPGIPGARSIEVRVVYMKSGAVSPEYRTATFAGVERFFTLSVGRAEAMRNGRKLSAALAAGRVPKRVSITITGRLPSFQ